MWKEARILLAGAVLSLASASVLADAKGAITAALNSVLPQAEITSIAETPVPGLYEVMMGPQVLYVSGDGRYMVQGRLVDLVEREDLTEPRQAEARRQAVEAVGEANMVVFAGDKADHTVTVFTDIDCGYCRKLHSQIDEYEDEGIRVRYVFYPRAGVKSESYKEAVSVWCSEDRNKAMTEAKAGRPIEEKTCDNPVQSHMELGELLGISGTPAIVLDNGDLVPGYVPPKRLAAIIKANGR